MIKEKIAVKDVEVVLEVLKEYQLSKKDMPSAVVSSIVEKLNNIKEDYDKTIEELLESNSLAVKTEKLMGLIGTIGTISVTDEDKLDKALIILDNCVESIKD